MKHTVRLTALLLAVLLVLAVLAGCGQKKDEGKAEDTAKAQQPPEQVTAPPDTKGEEGPENYLDITGVDDRDVWVGIRPEGFVYAADGPLKCALTRVEVMGRDVSVVSTHPALSGVSIRSIISAEIAPQIGGDTVRFAVKPAKVHIFDRATEERIRFSVR